MLSSKLYLFSLLLVFTTSYVYEKDFTLAQLKRDNGWLYLDSFVFSPDQIKMYIRLAVIGKGESKTHQLFLQFVPSQRWPAQIQSKCNSGLNIPMFVEPLRMNGQVQYNTINFGIQEVDTYHLVVKDCLQQFRKDYDNHNVRVFLRLTMRDGKDQPFKESLLAPNHQNQIDNHRQLAISSAKIQQQKSNEQRSEITDANPPPQNEANSTHPAGIEVISEL